MRTMKIPAIEIEPGMTLCGDDGKPFAQVLSAKTNREGGVRVLTPFLPVHYAPGGYAVVVVDES